VGLSSIGISGLHLVCVLFVSILLLGVLSIRLSVGLGVGNRIGRGSAVGLFDLQGRVDGFDRREALVIEERTRSSDGSRSSSRRRGPG